MTTTQIVIVDQTKSIDPALLHAAAVALNQQVTEDLPQYWSGIDAAVSVAPSLSAVPHGAWPVFLVKELPPGEGGYHLDKHNQPYAKVIASAADESWTIDASHETIEMLVDPYGNRMQSSQAIKIEGNGVADSTGTYSYLVEACDPCEANDFAYEISGIALSDFITPHFYDATETPGVLYSCRGNIKRPRQLLKGGYISFALPSGDWQQILWVDPSEPPQLNNLGATGAVRSLREHVHTKMGPKLDAAKHEQRRKAKGLPAVVRERTAERKTFRAHAKEREEKLTAWYELR
jgi:hypothetical protein